VSPAGGSQELDQYGRAQALEACLVDAGLPAELTPVDDGGQAQIDWARGHEVLARDFEQWSTLLPGAADEVDPATHEKFMDVEMDELTSDLAPALWVDGQDHTDTWIRCLESSGYTNPIYYPEEEDQKESLLIKQRMADAANNWMACARENGLPNLADVTADVGDSPYGPHAEIPLDTEPALLRTVVDACPLYDEEIIRRALDSDPTLQDDYAAGRATMGPLVLVEEPEGMQEAASLPEGFDFDSGDGLRYRELGEILNKALQEIQERYSAEQAQDPTGGTAPAG
jgi:hypothetical protein